LSAALGGRRPLPQNAWFSCVALHQFDFLVGQAVAFELAQTALEGGHQTKQFFLDFQPVGVVLMEYRSGI
jgi:hypothetical protein